MCFWIEFCRNKKKEGVDYKMPLVDLSIAVGLIVLALTLWYESMKL